MKKVLNLITLFEKSNLSELSYQDSEFSLSLKKGSQTSSESLISSEYQEGLNTQLKSSDNAFILSEGVGIFYASPSPDKSAFIEVGDVIEKGQVIGILEAMKVMTEIKATTSGKVEKIFVSNGEMIEYGTKLIEVSNV